MQLKKQPSLSSGSMLKSCLLLLHERIDLIYIQQQRSALTLLFCLLIPYLYWKRECVGLCTLTSAACDQPEATFQQISQDPRRWIKITDSRRPLFTQQLGLGDMTRLSFNMIFYIKKKKHASIYPTLYVITKADPNVSFFNICITLPQKSQIAHEIRVILRRIALFAVCVGAALSRALKQRRSQQCHVFYFIC